MNFSNFSTPQKSNASIDGVIEQIQSLAGEIHQLGKEVNSKVSTIGLRGEKTITNFDSTFGEIGTNVDQIINNFNNTMLLSNFQFNLIIFGFGSIFGFLIFLAILWILAFLFENIFFSKRRGMK